MGVGGGCADRVGMEWIGWGGLKNSIRKQSNIHKELRGWTAEEKHWSAAAPLLDGSLETPPNTHTHRNSYHHHSCSPPLSAFPSLCLLVRASVLCPPDHVLLVSEGLSFNWYHPNTTSGSLAPCCTVHLTGSIHPALTQRKLAPSAHKH